MCSLTFPVLGRGKSDSATVDASLTRRSVRPERRADDELVSALLAFFRKRLRPDGVSAARSQQARLLVHRTLDRMARRRASEAPVETSSSGIRLKMEEVMRAALMELRRLEEPAPSPDEAGPLVHRN